MNKLITDHFVKIRKNNKGKDTQDTKDVAIMKKRLIPVARTTISQDVQTRFSVQFAFAKFLSKIKGILKYSASTIDTALPQKFPFILDRNLA